MIHICRADVVACKIDSGTLALIFRQRIVERMRQHFDRSTCSKVRTTNTDYNQYLGIALNFSSSLLDACKFFFIIIGRQVNPTQEIGTYTCLVVQLLMSQLDRLCKIINFVLTYKGECFSVIKNNFFRHDWNLLFGITKTMNTNIRT
ncbi:hypothetical protein D3C75_1003840 [compost metagenome]